MVLALVATAIRWSGRLSYPGPQPLSGKDLAKALGNVRNVAIRHTGMQRKRKDRLRHARGDRQVRGPKVQEIPVEGVEMRRPKVDDGSDVPAS